MAAEARDAKAAASRAKGVVEPTRVSTALTIEPIEAPISEAESEVPLIPEVSAEEMPEISVPEEIIAEGQHPWINRVD